MSKRKQFTLEQKVAMVRRHLIENVPVSDLCDEHGIHATQYYGPSHKECRIGIARNCD